ncbi:MAG: GNAT family N-acetyltransferase [Clostridia bacterium]|nr:GNAT family N-acetyltransferase [Clostridia bacterium]
MHSFVLETPRLILRPLTVADAEAEFVWLSDPEVNRFMPYNLYTSVDEARAWLRHVEQCTDEYHFGFVRREDGLLVGAGSIGPKDGRPYAIAEGWEFGYNLRRDCWNMGYATEATRAMIGFARQEFGVRVFYASHAVDNPASGRVMEKVGCTFDHFNEYSTFDGSETFPAKVWKLVMED